MDVDVDVEEEGNRKKVVYTLTKSYLEEALRVANLGEESELRPELSPAAAIATSFPFIAP